VRDGNSEIRANTEHDAAEEIDDGAKEEEKTRRRSVRAEKAAVVFLSRASGSARTQERC
jgi:hypothetical protein